MAMRRICKRIAGPGLMFTEFVSAMAIHYGAVKTFRKMRIHPEERPLGIQIFGGEPAVMAETARIAEEMGADIIDINMGCWDINMGCWVPKVCKTGSGAALLKDPDTAEAIVKAVVGAVQKPVTVKLRAGWDYSLFAAPEMAKRFQDAGAQMITLHARFAKQGFEGEANWALIREMREVVRVPLIGNGDVKTPEDAKKMLESTGCDGVMVGRAAIGDPWALARIRAGMMGDPIPEAPSLEERIETARDHARMHVALECDAYEFEEIEKTGADYSEAERRAIRSLRGLLPLYIKGEPGASQVRARITHCDTLGQVENILDGYLCERRALLPVG